MEHVSSDCRDGWYFACRRVAHQPSTPDRAWLAWCARTPNLRGGPLDLPIEEPAFYAFGPSEEVALAELRGRV